MEYKRKWNIKKYILFNISTNYMKKYGEKKCENYIVDERGIIDILYKKKY